MGKEKRKFSSINVYPITLEQAKYVKRGSDEPIAKTVAEFYKWLMQLCARFDTNPFTLSYEFTLFPKPQLVIKATGKSTFQIGEIPKEAELEAERKARFQEVALSIAEHRGKDVRIKGE